MISYLAQTETETLGRIRIQRFYSNCKNINDLNFKKKLSQLPSNQLSKNSEVTEFRRQVEGRHSHYTCTSLGGKICLFIMESLL
jgi:hypothetical protein